MQMMTKIPNTLIGASGVHYVVSELSRRGMIALPTIRNTAAFDVIVTSCDGKRHANIQVKTSLKKVQFWRMPDSKRVCCGPKDYYVLLRWEHKLDRFEGFMVSGRMAKEAVAEGEAFQRKRVMAGSRKEVVPSIYFGEKRKDWKRRWNKKWLQWSI
jgi:hypothetical protein